MRKISELLMAALIACALLQVSACTPNTTQDASKAPTNNNNIETKDSGMTHQTLNIQTFNPGSKSIFPVTSTLISGPTEVILIDAQFQKDDAKAVVEMIRAGGKTLKSVYISHGDPDYYFGLDEIRKAFPEVKIEATPMTRAYIEKSMYGKLEYWGPILEDNAPAKLILPDVIKGDTLNVDGIELKIMGSNGPYAKHSFVWIPDSETILGGVSLYGNMHVWMADAQTQDARNAWKQQLEVMLALKPKRVIPGHFLGDSAEDISIITYTKDYIDAFETASKNARTSEALKAEILRSYPNVEGISDLEMSAKVFTGEISWP